MEVPTTPGARWSNEWHNGIYAQAFPASLSASSYTMSTSTSASTSSGLVTAGPTSSSVTPWTHASHLSEEISQGVCSPGSSAQLGAPTQDVTADGAPFPTTMFKAVVSSSAVRKVSEGRRTAEPRFPCPFPGCGHASTRKENLKSEQLFLRRHTLARPSTHPMTQLRPC